MAIYKSGKVTLDLKYQVTTGRRFWDFSEGGLEVASLDQEQARHIWALLNVLLDDVVDDTQGLTVRDSDGRVINRCSECGQLFTGSGYGEDHEFCAECWLT